MSTLTATRSNVADMGDIGEASDPTGVIVFNYPGGIVPDGYKCACGATGCKLWHPLQASTREMESELKCTKCAAKNEGMDPADFEMAIISSSFSAKSRSLKFQIGKYVPAVPDAKDPKNTLGWQHVSEEGLEWWEGLPTQPAKLQQAA